MWLQRNCEYVRVTNHWWSFSTLLHDYYMILWLYYSWKPVNFFLQVMMKMSPPRNIWGPQTVLKLELPADLSDNCCSQEKFIHPTLSLSLSEIIASITLPGAFSVHFPPSFLRHQIFFPPLVLADYTAAIPSSSDELVNSSQCDCVFWDI